MKERLWKRLAKDESGVAAIEFAFVVPAFLTLVLGIINLSLLGLTLASLHYSVEEGARCASVKMVCPEPKSRYFAPGPIPVFTSSKGPCGFTLSATVTFNLNVILYQRAIPLTAIACFP